MNVRLLAALTLLPLAAVLLVSTALAGRGAESVSTAKLRGVNFVSACTFSHAAADDPIVFPGKPGASHHHSFIGNATTSASSTLETLLGGASTCHRPGDTAAYWMPTLLQNGQPVMPVHAQIYYRRSTQRHVEAFPPGFRMIAGDAKATSPQGVRITFWSCGIASGVDRSADVPTCPDTRGSFLRLHIRFAECWDGRRLDSTDHKSHMAYAVRGQCPSTHPVELPQITQIYRYASRGGESFSLASGGVYSAHADFLNAWKPGALRKLVDGCLNALVHCGRS